MYLVEKKVKTENCISTFPFEGVIIIKILKQFHKTSFLEINRSISKFLFFGDIYFGPSYWSTGMKFPLDTSLALFKELSLQSLYGSLPLYLFLTGKVPCYQDAYSVFKNQDGTFMSRRLISALMILSDDMPNIVFKGICFK